MDLCCPSLSLHGCVVSVPPGPPASIQGGPAQRPHLSVGLQAALNQLRRAQHHGGRHGRQRASHSVVERTGGRGRCSRVEGIHSHARLDAFLGTHACMYLYIHTHIYTVYMHVFLDTHACMFVLPHTPIHMHTDVSPTEDVSTAKAKGNMHVRIRMH